MTIALSRTGLSPMRMQVAAQALLASGGDDTPAMGAAASVSQLYRDSDQIAHALRFIRDIGQEVTVLSRDLRYSIRTRLIAVDQRPGQLRLRVNASNIPKWITTTDSLILSGRFIGRPMVCALNAVGASYPGEFQIVTPAWMLLAEQRASYRVKLADCHLTTPWGEMATALDLAESGLAFVSSAPPQRPVQEGAGWSSLLLHKDLETEIPVYLSIVDALPDGIAGMRVGAHMHVTGMSAKLRLQRLLRSHVDLFGELQTASNPLDGESQADFLSPGVLGAVSPAPTFSIR
ncbi:MAG: hypothetical protein Q8M20_08450 [Rhodocyclaceae bacterium]|nr:hypothetical protein [Rhodocyclaceae bacterium]MDZ4216502.1 hypothetical protein [Rhodocyclaceae bacterium]